jgi:hypothetical protein
MQQSAAYEATYRTSLRAAWELDSVLAPGTEQQLAAARWTYIGAGMSHPKFLELVTRMAPASGQRVIEAAQSFG